MKHRTLYIILKIMVVIVIVLALAVLFKKTGEARVEYERTKKLFERLQKENDSLNSVLKKMRTELKELENYTVY